MLTPKHIVETSMLKSDDAPKCDLTFALLAALKRAVDNGPFSRPMVIERMNEALGGEKMITKDIFSKWFSASAPTKMPAEYLPAFCWATRSVEPFSALLAPIDFSPVDGRGLSMVSAAELALQAQQMLKQSENMFAQILEQAAISSSSQHPSELTSLRK